MSIAICSFLPAATQMIYDLGLQDLLSGVTFECHEKALQEKPAVVRNVLEGKEFSSSEIDKIYSASKAEGKSLYYVDEYLLRKIQPDIIFTQDVCDVCQIDARCTADAISRLSKKPRLITLSPQRLADVFNCLIDIARAADQEEKAYDYLSGVNKKLEEVVDKLRRERVMPKRVMVIEWTDPVYNCGHWIPDQIAWAGGIDMLSNPGGYSIPISWEKVLNYDPEVLVVAPCGYSARRTLDEILSLTGKRGWAELTAVKNDAVYIADYDLFTQPAVSTLVNGIEALSAIFHPDIFQLADQLKPKVFHFSNKLKEYAHGH